MDSSSQSEYQRGVSAWNFDIEDLKVQASLIQDDEDLVKTNEDDGIFRHCINNKEPSTCRSSLGKTLAAVKISHRFGLTELQVYKKPFSFFVSIFKSPNMIISSAAVAAAAAAVPFSAFTSTAPPPSHPPTTAIFLNPCSTTPLRSALRLSNRRKLKRIGNLGGRRGSNLCRAELVHDAPFAAAIVACVLTSLVAPIHSSSSEDEDGSGAIDSTDARFAVMGIIGFIPFFNWLSWVFAWLDTSRSRYLVYSIVYLAPYLRTNLSLSPEESWLPITSILICIIHIQLEASIKNGDLEGFAFFNKASKLPSPFTGKKNSLKSHHKSSETGKKP